MQHCAAYLEAAVAAVTDSQINALADNLLSIRNNNFFLPYRMRLNWAAAVGAVMTRARLTSPTLRTITTPQITPITVGAVVGANPRVADYRRNPFVLPGGEELSAQATVGAVGGTQVIVLGLDSDETPSDPVPSGDIFTLRAASTTAATANAWSDVSATLTFDDQLPPGRYAVVGMGVVAVGMYAARLILRGQAERPGVVGIAAAGDAYWAGFLKGEQGVLGYFNNDVMPGLEVLENAATAAHELFIDIIRVGPRAGY